MSIIWWALLSLALLWSGLLLVNRRYDLKKRGFTIGPGLLTWRTKRGLRFIDRVARASKGGWRAFGTAAAVVGIFFMILMFLSIAKYATVVVRAPEAAPPGVRFVIPGVTVPLWAPLVAIAVLLVVHEFSHGFVLRAQELRTKSVGGLLLLAIPGAFVEPDEKQLNRSSVPERLRVFGAGSFANILFAFVCVGLILLFLGSPQPGVYIFGVKANTPAADNLLLGDRLLQIDNVAIDNLQNFSDFMENTRENDRIIVWVEREGKIDNFPFILKRHGENENRGYLGIAAGEPLAPAPSRFANPLFTMSAAMVELLRPQSVFHPYCYDARVPWSVIELLKWMFVLNMLIGLFNLLPAKPLDGGYLAAGLVEWRTSAKTAKRVSDVLSILVLGLIIINLTPMFLR